MLKNSNLTKQIHEANVAVHRLEAKYYEALHPEVYSRKEQKRIANQLKTLTAEITDNHKRALDVGAGTGNITGKLLELGYNVVANDISPEMCQILRKKYAFYLGKQLTVLNMPIEDLFFGEGQFDLIVGYSVFHHLPDYLRAIRTLAFYLKTGGVFYMDHEASTTYWSDELGMLASIMKALYFHSNPTLNSIYFQIIGLNVPTIDYTLSDYWHKKEHALNHDSIANVFCELHFQYAKRADYYQTSSWMPNPLSPFYRLLCSPEMSCWIAKK